VPPAADLSPVRVVFASGIAELNQTMAAHFAVLRPELPLYVVAEFKPEAGEWIPWHVHRTFDQNLAYVKAALAGRRIEQAAAAFDRRSALGDLRRAAQVLAPAVLTAYDEEMRMAAPGGFLLRRKFRRLANQLRKGGRAHAWLRRIVHPSEAEIPIRARLAQAKGLAASRTRSYQSTSAQPATLQSRDREGAVPGITVVIPTRDGLELLREMLPPLLPQLKRGEVIVVDNGSTDETAAWLAREHPAIRVIHHAEALSFARAVNQGIREARYTRTLLLNNDMIAEPGFIDALDDAFTRVPDLFCATAQIFFPAGIRREETGKTVWRTERELDFPVRCDDPLPGEDLTWVLYGSGGCSLFDTAKLTALGGVSELYDPAYVEDLDFGFRAWKYSWPSVYCAQARVEHRHRSTTSRFYTARQIDFFVERNYLRFVATAVANRELFERLWLHGIRRLQLQAMQGSSAALDTLRDVPAVSATVTPATGHLSEPEILALSNGDIALFPGASRSGGKTVLIASPYLPYPLSHGGAVRIYNLMKLAAGYDNLILVAFTDEQAPPPVELLAICTQIVLVRRHGTHYKRNTTWPDVVEEFDSEAFRACLKQAAHQWQPDIAQLEFTWMAQYADACYPAKTILVEHDITFDLQQQLLAISPGSGPAQMELEQQLEKWRAFETAAWNAVDCVVTMSAKDTQIVNARSVACLPNGVDCERFQPVASEPDRHRLLLIGSFAHLPNLLALEFFVNEVWPKLSPDYRLHIIGGARHDYYLDYFRDRISIDLNQPGIEIEGFVADVRNAYHRAAIVLAPLTASAGTNIKVLEAMAMGKAIVSTAAGVNGIDITPNQDFLLSESAVQMAAQIHALVADSALRKSIERNARQTALLYDWRAIGDRQRALYQSLPDIQ
jgi:GT2 family glycosyltransferase/glycosyltransferase involved in cell wall biosynthesis